jgi:hypothetical protein
MTGGIQSCHRRRQFVSRRRRFVDALRHRCSNSPRRRDLHVNTAREEGRCQREPEQPEKIPAFRWVSTVLANLKTAITPGASIQEAPRRHYSAVRSWAIGIIFD